MPQWKQKIANHTEAGTNLSGVWESAESMPGYQRVRYRSRPDSTPDSSGATENVQLYTGHIAEWFNSMPLPDFTWTSVAERRARNKFLAEVREIRTKMQGAVFVKELDKTYSMLRRPAEALWQQIREYYAALRKAKRKSPLGWYTAIPALWLEYTFGWKPLMMDIADAKKAFDTISEKDHIVGVRGSGSDSSRRGEQSGNFNGQSPAIRTRFNYRYVTLEKETVKYIGGVRFLASSTLADKAAQFGFTPEEFLPSAWEILPWSFLIDYFVSIGDYLDATFADTSTIAWCSRVTRKESKRTYDVFPDDTYMLSQWGSAVVKSVSSQPSRSILRKHTVSREVVSGGSLSAALYVKWNGPTWGQFANMSALFGQACVNLHNQNLSGKTYRLR